MVSRSYMVRRPSAPGALKRTVDQAVIPAAVNLAGWTEGILMRASQRTRRTPVACALAALAGGYLLRGIVRRL